MQTYADFLTWCGQVSRNILRPHRQNCDGLCQERAAQEQGPVHHISFALAQAVQSCTTLKDAQSMFVSGGGSSDCGSNCPIRNDPFFRERLKSETTNQQPISNDFDVNQSTRVSRRLHPRADRFFCWGSVQVTADVPMQLLLWKWKSCESGE